MGVSRFLFAHVWCPRDRPSPGPPKISPFFFLSPAAKFVLFFPFWVSSRILVVFLKTMTLKCARLEFSSCCVCVRHVNQQSAEAPSHGIVMFNRKVLRTLRRNRSEQIICPRTHAEEQHQPCTLQIGDCWDLLQQLPVGSGRLLEESPHALRMPQRGAKHFHPLLRRREFRISALRPGRPAELLL